MSEYLFTALLWGLILCVVYSVDPMYDRTYACATAVLGACVFVLHGHDADELSSSEFFMT